jgi:Zn-dependent M28 family amino/carboxypeptidase
VDEGRLRGHVEALANAPRVPGSPEHERAGAYIPDHFRSPRLHPMTQSDPDTGENIVAELGLSSGPLFVNGAHCDSVAGSPGADDNASTTS